MTARHHHSATPEQEAQILRFWQGFMTEREIAQHLGLHTATVRAVLRLHTAEAVAS